MDLYSKILSHDFNNNVNFNNILSRLFLPEPDGPGDSVIPAMIMARQTLILQFLIRKCYTPDKIYSYVVWL